MSESQRIAGSYRLDRLVGSGGMGVVHEAWDTRLERRVALKMVHPHLLADPAVSVRFEKEAKRAARIEHPNVVRVYRVDTYEGRVAIEMQFVDGTPLNVLLRAGPLSPSHAADVLRQVLEALDACHEQGVIHCDLKPGNLLVTRDGRVMLTDFGIARALYDPGDPNATDSSTGVMTSPLWGTPQYCPPEAWDGGAITQQWDLYAAGTLTYEAIAGAAPFHGQTPAALMKSVLTANPPALNMIRSDTSKLFAELIATMMARDPAARPASARSALAVLRKTAEFEGAITKETEPLPNINESREDVEVESFNSNRVNPPKIRRWVSIGLVAVLMVLFFATAGLVRWEDRTPAALVTRDPESSNLLVVHNTAYFAADDGVHGRELWCSELNSNTCKLVADIEPGLGSSNPRDFMLREAGGFAFVADTSKTGAELWFCNGDSADPSSVRLIQDINPDAAGSDPMLVSSKGETILFYASTMSTGRELWWTDATTLGGATIVEDFYRGAASSMEGGARSYEAEKGLYLVSKSDLTRGFVLSHYNYADKTLEEVADVSEYTGSMTKVGNRLIFKNYSDDSGFELRGLRRDQPRVESIGGYLAGIVIIQSRPILQHRWPRIFCS